MQNPDFSALCKFPTGEIPIFPFSIYAVTQITNYAHGAAKEKEDDLAKSTQAVQ